MNMNMTLRLILKSYLELEIVIKRTEVGIISITTNEDSLFFIRQDYKGIREWILMTNLDLPTIRIYFDLDVEEKVVVNIGYRNKPVKFMFVEGKEEVITFDDVMQIIKE